MNHRRVLATSVGFVAAAGVLLACTLTQSLDYLQKGAGPADGATEASSGEAGTRVPTVLVPNQTKPGFLAQDGMALYWIAGGMAWSVPKSGGTAKVLGAVPPSSTLLVAEPDPTGAIFVLDGSAVHRLPKDGSGGGGIVFTGNAGEPPTDTIAASASSLYVLQYDPTLAIEGSRILRMAKDGGGATDIAPDSGPVTLNRDVKSVFWLGSDPAKPAIVEQLETAAPGTTTAVYALSANDDLPTLSADIAVDDAFLYWITSDPASASAEIVGRKREASASVVAIYRGAPEDAFANITVDATHVYFIETRTSSLLRVPKSGGDVDKLLVGLKAPSGLVVDATSIYLTVEATGTTGQILAVMK